jgi:hypothetical protein
MASDAFADDRLVMFQTARKRLQKLRKKALEPKPFVSRPISVWDSLKFAATEHPLEPSEEVPP